MKRPLALSQTIPTRREKGFTLIETLVAISLLMIAMVAPMTLTVQSLASAYYARDQITASYLAQEGLEAVIAIVDGQILQIAESSNASGINIFGPIPLNQNFTIDARQTDAGDAISECSGTCPPLQTDGNLYGYQSGWTNTTFTRTVYASFVGSSQDELRVTVTVSWKTASYATQSVTLSEDLYRWVQDGSGV